MTDALPPWMTPLWRRATGDPARLPHAILLTGPRGSGKRRFAEALAERLLCQRAQAEAMACGQCPSCRWFADANHPDVHRLVPASEEGIEEDEGESGKKEKAKSSLIVIDQVRALQQLLEIGSHQGGRRILLIDPAEAMNHAAANALLKSLEEPPTDAVFLLVSHAPGRLLPTILSRCQVWPVPRPDAGVAVEWLREQKLPKAEALLGFASGLPLAAKDIAEGPLGVARERFVRDIAGLGSSSDPLKLAGEWEAWLKTKAATEAGLTMATLIGWLQRWLSDGARAAQGAPVRFFADGEATLAGMAKGRGAAWLACYNELMAYVRVAQHPLNQRLLLEDVLLRVARATR